MGSIRGIFHHYFYPHESNNFRAKTLHASSILFYIVLLFAFQIGATFLYHYQRNVLGFATDISSQKIIELVNQKRQESNLPPLSESLELSSAATNKASDMFSYNYWAHISPSGQTPWVFITSTGYKYIYAGENLAKDFDYSQDVVDAWMKSPTHRANLLKPEYKEIGVAVVNGRLNGQDTTLVVQEFGARLAKETASQDKPTTTSEKEIIEISQLPSIEGELDDREEISPISQSLIFGINAKTTSLVLSEFLLVVLFVDSIYMWRHRTQRLVSHSLAHFIFLAAIIGAMSAAGIGVIL
ncbi:hypothetical protein HYW55_03595 [Candidatus Gottesmanbacteria bacterium]|nr:hypothetical protein [Candidatus Gottesmanbacteria bacterium]